MATGYIMLDTARPDPQQGMYPRRGGYRPSGTCIVHTTEGDWRRGVQALISLVLSRADHGCYHEACDWADIAKLYPWIWETWQDTETNNWAVGIAAACKTSDWGNMPADVEDGFYRNLGRMAAEFVIYMRETYGVTVPLRRITGAEARARVPGFCAHGDSGVARSDPGANFDWARFFDYTRQALAGTLQEEEMKPEQMQELKLFIQNENVRYHEATRKAIPQTILDTVVQGVMGDQITLRQLLAEYRSHVTQITSGIAEVAAKAAAGGASVEEIRQAITAQFSAGLHLEATFKVPDGGE